jgi:hypothetical protein
MYIVLIVTTLKRGDEKYLEKSPVNDPGKLLLFTFAQYFVHIYSVFALRASNQHLLTGDSENSWGFGQVVALVMLGQPIIGVTRGLKSKILLLWQHVTDRLAEWLES